MVAFIDACLPHEKVARGLQVKNPGKRAFEQYPSFPPILNLSRIFLPPMISTAQLLADLHDDDAVSVAARLPGTTVVVRLPNWDELSDTRNDAVVPRNRPLLPNFHHVKFLTVTGAKASWTQEAVDSVSSLLTERVQVYTRELTDDQCSARIRLTSRFWRGDEYTISSLTIPLFKIDEEGSCRFLQLPNLAEIFLGASNPHDVSRSKEEIALSFLGSFNTLVVATIVISSDSNLVNVLKALKDSHPGLTRLAVLVDRSYNVVSIPQSLRIELEDRMIRGLEGFAQLEHLVLDEGLMCPLLLEAIRRLHHLKRLNCIAQPFSESTEAEVSRLLRSSLEHSPPFSNEWSSV